MTLTTGCCLHISTEAVATKLLICVMVAGPLYVIVEYAPYGNLREFLHERQSTCTADWNDDIERQRNSLLPASLSYGDLLSFAFQIARGLEYMSSKMVSDGYYCVVVPGPYSV